MVKGNTLREIRFKDGYRISKGDLILIVWSDPKKNPTQVQVLHRNRQLDVPAGTALAWIGLKASLGDLEDAACGGTCKSPNGHPVEPDGVDPEGAPSWFRIHGLI